MDLIQRDGSVIELDDNDGNEENEMRQEHERAECEAGEIQGKKVIWMPIYVCQRCGMLNYGKMLKGCTSRERAEQIMASVLDGTHLGGEYGWIKREKPHKCPSGAVGIQRLEAIDRRWTLR